jgi:hypothetical protein
MIEMELSRIFIDEKLPDQAIVLKERHGERLLPIIIGHQEAMAIQLKVAGKVPARPLTHDLLKSVIEALGSRVARILIDKLEDSTFHAKIVLTRAEGLGGGEEIVDARPSDSIALAVRVKAPIFVEEEVIRRSESFHQGQ